jgi:hypothetical protein
VANAEQQTRADELDKPALWNNNKVIQLNNIKA